jgi:hypothetical protein
MKALICCASLVLLFVTGFASGSPHLVRDKKCGIEVRLPSTEWSVEDLSSHGVICRVYAPPGRDLPRVALMRYPAAFLPEGMTSRASHVEGVPGNRRIHIKPGTLAGRKGQEYQWRNPDSRAIEVGVLREGHYYIVQVSAEFSDWKDEARAASYRRVLESARLLDIAAPPLRVDKKTAEEVRAIRRKRHENPRRFAIVSHDIRLNLYPRERRLAVTDDFVVEGLGEPIRELSMICTHVDVNRFAAAGNDLRFRTPDGRSVRVTLDRPLRKGERRTIRFEAQCPKFRFALDQKLIAEMAVLGQVEKDSSFSSHVCYYPIDERNDAAVKMAISVPQGYTAVTGGNPVGVEVEGKRRVFRYEDPLRTPRLLPFGFAAAKYESLTGRTAEGLELVVYFLEGFEKQARQRIAVLEESGNLFEKRMGSLPWKRVAFCHVKPHRKETGVSLPGLVLFSDGFFDDLEGAEVTADLVDRTAGSPLLFADELSHQWNAYSVPLPNVLAEGVSTFTDLLYIEAKAGAAEYREALRRCADRYLLAAETLEDVAVADPKLYRSQIYRTVSFLKSAVVLDQLRRQLGDKRFFAAWRKAFEALRGGPAEFEDLERELSRAAKIDLRRFFDQWFFQAGHPRLLVTWSRPGPDRIRLEVEQTQPGGAFDLTVPVEVTNAKGKRQLQISLSRRQEHVDLAVDGDVRSLRVDPERRILLLRSRVKGP